MHVLDRLQTALESLGHSKLRSLLTVLGLIIGVASVIITLALGNGAQEAVREQFRGLGSNELSIFPVKSATSTREPRPITYEEALGLADLPQVSRVKASLGGGATLVYGRESLDSSLTGVGASWLEDLPADYIAGGEFFNEDDVADATRVAVIGQTVVDELFDGDDPIGQELRIDRVHYLVIGVIIKMDQENPMFDPNNIVLVPITAATELLGKDQSVNVQVRIKDEQESEAVVTAIEGYFREAHEIDPGQDLDVMVFDPSQITEAQQEAANTMAALLVSLAVVSLAVGGIGVMNVMLVSVIERTREIGVRLAVGAARGDVAWQFLVEAVTLSLGGGVLGVAAGILAIPVISHYRPDLSIMMTWRSIPLSFGVAVAVGLFFGLYPALRAARLDPVEALRYE